MAEQAWRVFSKAKQYLMDGTIDLDTDTFNITLHTSAAALTTALLATLTVIGSVGNEVVSTSGYSTSGTALQSVKLKPFQVVLGQVLEQRDLVSNPVDRAHDRDMPVLAAVESFERDLRYPIRRILMGRACTGWSTTASNTVKARRPPPRSPRT